MEIPKTNRDKILFSTFSLVLMTLIYLDFTDKELTKKTQFLWATAASLIGMAVYLVILKKIKSKPLFYSGVRG
jgi:hypothetical protein